ncbi:MAG: mechanosensitive ion channel [Methylomicrobium sp.]
MEILKSLPEISIVYMAAIIVAAWLVIALQQWLFAWLAERFSGKRRLYMLAAVPVCRLLTIMAAIILVITHLMEPTLQNFIALLGTMGLALGFALKDYVSSQIAGIVTLFEMPYRLGDWIAIDDIYGEVKKINMRALEIVTPDDTRVTIPHQKLWNSSIHNANDGTHNLMCVADFYLHPRHDGSKVKDALYDVALTSAYLQLSMPIVVVASEKPWGTHYRLKAYPIEPRDQFRFVTDLTLRAKDALAELGIEFSVCVNRPVLG